MTTTYTLAGYDNEDIVQPFALTTGSASAPTAFDLTNFDIEAEIVDAKTGASVLRMTTNGVDNLAQIPSPATSGIFTLTIPHKQIIANAKQSLKFDVLLKNKNTGAYKRALGGAVDISPGVTDPE